MNVDFIKGPYEETGNVVNNLHGASRENENWESEENKAIYGERLFVEISALLTCIVTIYDFVKWLACRALSSSDMQPTVILKTSLTN